MLIGRAPANISIPPAPLAARIPVVPPGVPSTLLERRPDIAATERTMEAENAQIGVAVAAYYPQVTLFGALRLYRLASRIANLSGQPHLVAWSRRERDPVRGGRPHRGRCCGPRHVRPSGRKLPADGAHSLPGR